MLMNSKTITDIAMKINGINSFRCCLLVLLCCVTAAGPGCNIQKRLSSQKNELMISEEQNVLAKSVKQVLLHDTHIFWQVDSSGSFYRVSILPLDTFDFSPQHGFSGRALSVEIEGYNRSRSSLGDNSVRNVAVTDTQLIRLENSRLQEQSSRSRVKEKENKPEMSLIVVVLVCLFVVVGGYFIKRSISNK